MKQNVKLFTGFERFWHWTQTLLIKVLTPGTRLGREASFDSFFGPSQGKRVGRQSLLETRPRMPFRRDRCFFSLTRRAFAAREGLVGRRVFGIRLA